MFILYLQIHQKPKIVSVLGNFVIDKRSEAFKLGSVEKRHKQRKGGRG